MNALPAVGYSGGCPDRDLLAAFNAGRLREPDMEKLAEHISTCAGCENTLLELMARPADSFEAGLLRVCAELPANAAAPTQAEVKSPGAPWHAETVTEDARRPAQDTEVPETRRIGPYFLLGVLGRGGMGLVFRAVHPVLHRMVALKTIHPGGEDRTDTLARFRLEGEVVARLEHPNIVRIYDFDECGGVPYFAMELMEGETLAAKLRRGRLELPEAAELVRTIASAVGYAHRQKVVHRDLKPSNVLIARDGTLKVTDFGLAKILEEGRGGLTQTDAVMGTPSYMAPEQAAGRAAEVGPRTDVYALGAILYEALVGAPPFVGESKSRVLGLVQAGRVVPPSRRRPEIPAALEAICLKCLEVLAEDRYANADELAEELDRWLKGEPTQTRRPGRVRRLLRRMKDRRVIAAMLLVAVGVGLVAALPPAWRQPAPKDSSTEIRTPDGRLLPFRVRYGDEKTKVTANADGTITVSSWSLCLVEYTPGPAGTPYRFRAKIRHEVSDRDGRVGVYFAHQAHPGTFGETHMFGRMTYNDIGKASDAYGRAEQAPPSPIPDPAENYVRLDFVTRVAGQDRPSTGSLELAAGAPFTVCGHQGNCWRALDIMVAPEAATGAWEGRAVGSASADKITAVFAEKLQHARWQMPGDDLLRTVTARYDPRGGVGLVVERSSASFRFVEMVEEKD
jgi:eukaryotic-like serine/threonine-protein kinase